MARTIIAIDWGTHSSKWAYATYGPDGSSNDPKFDIVYSELYLDAEGHLGLSRNPQPTTTKSARSIKRLMITAQQMAFWESPHSVVPLTLGELVAFSLCFLLCRAHESLQEHGHFTDEDLEVRFSLPNWVGIQAEMYARAHYEQAARVAAYLFGRRLAGAWTDGRITVDSWRRLVTEARDQLGILPEPPILEDPESFRRLLTTSHHARGAPTFRFVVESAAAGLMGLRYAVLDRSSQGRVLKLLVVDVGAGSSDIGYVLRTTPPEEAGVSEVLLQLPPAAACEVAGNNLTDRIQMIYRERGRQITLEEAEATKLGAPSDWLGHSSVQEWIERIAAQAASYVGGVPDRRWLPNEPALRVLVTGGSGVVDGLADRITEATKRALRGRGLPGGLCDITDTLEVRVEGAATAEVNRLAVVLGCLDINLPRLAYHERLDPPELGPRYKVIGKWVP